MLVHVMNPQAAQARTVTAGEALKNGQLVKWVANTAAGLAPKVMSADVADLQDPEVLTGVVTWTPEDALFTEFSSTNPSSARALTVSSAALTIASGQPCLFWIGQPVVYYHEAALDSETDIDDIREGEPVAWNSATSQIGVYDSEDADKNVVAGFCYRNASVGLEIQFIARQLLVPAES